MKIDQKTVRGLIIESIKKNLLLEGNFSDSLAGKMAYVSAMGIIVTVAARHAEKRLKQNPDEIDVRAPIKAQIDFNQRSSKVINSAGDENPIYKSIRFLYGIVDNPGSIFDMSTNPTFERIVGGNLKQTIKDIAKTHDDIKAELDSAETLGDQLPERKRTAMLENFSGIFNIDADYSFSSSKVALGAFYMPTDQSITIKMNFSKTLYDIFNERLSEEEINQRFASTMKWSQQALQQVKGSITHELVHSTQLDTFNAKQGFMQTIKGMINPVKQRLALNLKRFDDINKKHFPLLRNFQEKLEQFINDEIGGFLSSEEALVKYDLTRSHGMSYPWRGMKSFYEPGQTQEETFKIYMLSTAITFFSILANIFSPQEAEAYVRGDYVKIKKIVDDIPKQAIRDRFAMQQRAEPGKKSDRNRAIAAEFFAHAKSRYGHFFDPTEVPEWVDKVVLSLSGGEYSLEELHEDAYFGMVNVFKSIYGK